MHQETTTAAQQQTADLVLRPYQASDAEAFRLLNQEWIERFFRLEEKDRRTLGDPEGEILRKGGHIFIAQTGQQTVACVALLRYDDAQYELSKMAVSPEMRGQGVGRRLLQYTLRQSRAIGAHRVFLGSNSILQNAVHLYESIGFRHVPPEQLPYMGYARADVFMAYEFGEHEAHH